MPTLICNQKLQQEMKGQREERKKRKKKKKKKKREEREREIKRENLSCSNGRVETLSEPLDALA